jgi:hypothetical protein
MHLFVLSNPKFQCELALLKEKDVAPPSLAIYVWGGAKQFRMER